MAGIYPPITLAVNKFLGTLTNVIAYAQTADTLERGTLNRLIASSQDINVDNGDGKLVLSADVLPVTDLPEVSTLLTSVKPTVREQYIPVSEYKVVQMTINEYLMRGAFAAETAMSGFIAYLNSVMESTKQIYLYNMLVDLYQNYVPAQATQTVTVDLWDLTSITDPSQKQAAMEYNSNQLYTALILVLEEMGADSNKYNDLALTEVIDFSSLKLIGNSYFNVQMLVNTVATLLNSDKITEAQRWSETIMIPQGKFTNSDVRTHTIAWLCHKKKIQFGYFYNVATSFFDASTLNTNRWLHFSVYKDEIDALPAVVFRANYTANPAPYSIPDSVTRSSARSK